jgi:hypothetical protein
VGWTGSSLHSVDSSCTPSFDMEVLRGPRPNILLVQKALKFGVFFVKSESLMLSRKLCRELLRLVRYPGSL